MPVGASFVVELANEEVYIHDLMLAYLSESSFILTMIVQNKHNTVSAPVEDRGTLLKLRWRHKVEPSLLCFLHLGGTSLESISVTGLIQIASLWT